ncbi:hypothetical protein NDU88_002460 [Pleurodeles waltl]|uniref:Uncharacterized protein n=1 Tax=Pleurodeles waltl TaxID=8319 RepID=A0AAV7TKS6_PLEWA|nr:hypothetical protein NDU88_002460 [Pleurodeles waltl]
MKVCGDRIREEHVYLSIINGDGRQSLINRDFSDDASRKALEETTTREDPPQREAHVPVEVIVGRVGTKKTGETSGRASGQSLLPHACGGTRQSLPKEF